MIEATIHAGYFLIGFLCGALTFVGWYYRRLVELSWQVQIDINASRIVKYQIQQKINELEKRLREFANADKETLN